jgi:DNA replication protein DnaC
VPNEAARGEEARQRAVAAYKLAACLGPRYSPQRCSLRTFRLTHDRQRAAVERLRDVQASLTDFVKAGRCIVFYGSVGTGKDHLLAAMLYAAAMAGFSCHWVNGQEVYGAFRDRMDTGQREEGLLRELVAPDVLGVSDPIPPAGQPSAWNLAQLYRLLDRRYRALRGTWVSLNALSPEDADQKLTAPIFDRLREDAELVPCFWPSYREGR